jgi:quercetin dioxygenase-like cupin family protein
MPIHHNLLGAQLATTERIFPPIANEALGARSCSVHENVVVAGATIPLHKHAVEEIIVCLAGTAECIIDGGKPESYSTGSVVIIPANTPHTIRNSEAAELRQLSFFAGLHPGTEWLEDRGSIA